MGLRGHLTPAEWGTVVSMLEIDLGWLQVLPEYLEWGYWAQVTARAGRARWPVCEALTQCRWQGWPQAGQGKVERFGEPASRST